MKVRAVVVVGLLTVLLCTCQQELPRDGGPGAGAEQAAEVQGTLNPNILPAYNASGARYEEGKQDNASEFRQAHPQWFAITQGPKASFRPMKEWEPMIANIITYSDYMPTDDPVAATMTDIVKYSLPAGEVWVIVWADEARDDLLDRLSNAGVSQKEIDGKVKFFRIPNNAIWVIDFGPLPLVDDAAGEMVFSDFRYYPDRYLDDAIPTRLANRIGVNTYRAPFTYEGGNFQADGDEYCYFSERVYEYTGLKFADVEAVFQENFGCKKAVVLKDISNDGTGHIDMFFKLGGKQVAFVGEYTKVVDNENNKRMTENVKILESLVYADGSDGITVHRIPFPNPGKAFNENIPRTYINSTLYVSADGKYKVNLWPAYTKDKDLEAEALASWQAGMPDWVHQPIISDQISLYSGAVHCVTRTVPALPFKKAIADGECKDAVCQPPAGGYDWHCISHAEEDPGCWGPKWKCLCNHCEWASCNPADTCGNGTCDAGEDCFLCAPDCACQSDDPTVVCKFGTGKCISEPCGDGTCDQAAKENCETCPKDCSCSGDEVCAYGICTTDPCDGIPYEGCCDGTMLVYCDGKDPEKGLIGNLNVGDCAADNKTCGWVASNKWYDCGGKGEDPEGKFALDCHAYDFPPGCAGKECGDNGAGYSCGECLAGADCEADGKCGPCTPLCQAQGLECGDDGCAGSCGECGDSMVCDKGKCVAGPCDPVANCQGKQCGDDGCGGTCGACEADKSCSPDGLCIDVVQPDVQVEPDATPQDDVPVESDGVGPQPDAATDKDVQSEEEDDDEDDDGCTASGTGGNGLAPALFLVLLGLLALPRRRTA